HAGLITSVYLMFYFSSRRRHTRWPRDWSSDVCSSDLISGAGVERCDRMTTLRSPAARGQAGNSPTLRARGHGFQERLDVAQHFGEVVRLGDESIRAHLHREQLVPLLRPGGEDDDGNVLVSFV